MSEVPLLRAVVGSSQRLRSELVGSLTGAWDGPVVHAVEPDDLEDLLLGLETPTLFGDASLIVLRADVRYLTRHAKRLVTLAGRPAVAGALLLVTDTLAKNTVLGKALHRAEAYHAVEVPGPKQVEAWLVGRLHALEEAVERPAAVARALIAHCGNDPDALLAGLEVALLHAEPGRLGQADVDAVMGGRAGEPIWEFTGAVLDGELGRAFDLRHRDPELGGERALNAVAGEVRKRLCCLKSDDDAEVWRMLGGRRGGSLYYARKGARGTGRVTLQRVLRGVGLALRECRSGRDPSLVVERFMIDVHRVIRSGSRRGKAVSPRR